ncbi:MAG: thioesterase family protein [Nocardiaceae bacterium]|nr:thioesterase family protein [Nocardiaceae bacterium]
MSDPAPFQTLTTLTSISDWEYGATIGPLWTIGPKVHGGALMAVAAAAARQAVRDHDSALLWMQPVAASVDFLSAPVPGDVILRVISRKIGRQIATLDTEVWQGDKMCARAVVTMGALDDAPVRQMVDGSHMPAEPDESALTYDGPMSDIVHLSQVSHMRMDSASAHFLKGETGDPTMRLWARLFEADEHDEDNAVLFGFVLGDMSPPVVFNLGEFGWSPTVQLTAFIRRHPAKGWFRVVSSTQSVGSALFDEDHLVFDSTGAVVAQSRQLALWPRRQG